MLTYLDRYLRGEYEQVWVELLALGNTIRQEPIYTDALAVTVETMNRVRFNVELLIERLIDLGYVFGIYPDRHEVEGYLRPHNPPDREVMKKIAKYESLEEIGSFPLSLQIFWEVVGSVDLSGYHPSWPLYSDPLIIFPIDVVEADYSNWLYQVEESEVEAAKYYRIPLSPDYYHKANVSGGEPYQIRVPNYTIDGILENERLETTFVNYLRVCFRYGGFPGCQWHKGALPKELSGLVEGLRPI